MFVRIKGHRTVTLCVVFIACLWLLPQLLSKKHFLELSLVFKSPLRAPFDIFGHSNRSFLMFRFQFAYEVDVSNCKYSCMQACDASQRPNRFSPFYFTPTDLDKSFIAIHTRPVNFSQWHVNSVLLYCGHRLQTSRQSSFTLFSPFEE